LLELPGFRSAALAIRGKISDQNFLDSGFALKRAPE
jgi:hypothetical protein